MRTRILLWAAFALAVWGFLALDSTGFWRVSLTAGHTMWEFLALVCAVLSVQQFLAVLVQEFIRWRRGTDGEIKMLTNFVGVLAGLAILAAFIYSLGVLQTVGVVAAGFAGMLLGWSLQAPVSGVAAWVMVTLMRPFRVGDRVLFPSLGLSGDVKQVGLMYTVLDQVGGAIGSEEAIGRDILIPNAMLFTQVAVNYTPKAQARYFLDEVVIRITYDSDWDVAEKIMLDVAREVTATTIKESGQEPYIRSDIWDYGILMRLRYMTMAMERPRITHEIVKRIFRAIQEDPRVDVAIPFVYSYRKSTDAAHRRHFPGPAAAFEEVPVASVAEEPGVSPTHPPVVEALARDIAAQGLLQPIVVAPLGPGRYRLVVGKQRLEACRHLGWKTIPAIVQESAAPEVGRGVP